MADPCAQGLGNAKEIEQRAILYPFVKEYLNLIDAVDVLEN